MRSGTSSCRSRGKLGVLTLCLAILITAPGCHMVGANRSRGDIARDLRDGPSFLPDGDTILQCLGAMGLATVYHQTTAQVIGSSLFCGR
jgi:hypothetical protein